MSANSYSLVTVVIPTYNHAQFLGRALQSVMDQTYSNWEIFVVDNHSQDNTDEVVKGFGDPRIQLLKIHNQGVIAASRNFGIREGKGNWIAFLDSDDVWYPNKLEVCMKAAEESDSYDVISNFELMVDIRYGSKKILRHGPFQSDLYKILLIQGNRLSPSATLVRRTFLERHSLLFNESKNYITVEDYDLWLKIAHKGARFKFINYICGEYLIHSANNSSQIERHMAHLETLLREHVFQIQEFESNRELLWKQIFVRLQLTYAIRYMQNRQIKDAFKIIVKSLILYPNQVIKLIFIRIKNRLVEIRIF